MSKEYQSLDELIAAGVEAEETRIAYKMRERAVKSAKEGMLDDVKEHLPKVLHPFCSIYDCSPSTRRARVQINLPEGQVTFMADWNSGEYKVDGYYEAITYIPSRGVAMARFFDVESAVAFAMRRMPYQRCEVGHEAS